MLVFGGLAILTAATVGISYLGLPHGAAIALAALIAIVKCTLIGTFFMHLRFESKGFTVLIFAGLFLVGVLVVSLIPDIGTVN